MSNLNNLEESSADPLEPHPASADLNRPKSGYYVASNLRNQSCEENSSHKDVKALNTRKNKNKNPINPRKMWIDGKCFALRIRNKNREMPPPEPVKYEIQPEEFDNYDIKCNDEGKVYTSFFLPRFYQTKLIRHPYLNLKYLQKTTNTDIKLFGEDSNLTIIGDCKEKVAEAREELHSVIGDIRDQTAALQFISIPTLTEEIKSNFDKFKSEILSIKDDIPGMEESIFQSPLKLHFTIAVFALMDQKEISEAIKVFEDYNSTIFQPMIQKVGPLKIKIAGIDCMQPNYKKTDVLYAKAEMAEEVPEDFHLQKIANGILHHFYEKGLVIRYQENVKLHLTLINTKYRNKLSNSPKRKKWVKKESFDASRIMEKFRDFYFGTFMLDTVHLSLISSKGEDGYYKPLSIITASSKY